MKNKVGVVGGAGHIGLPFSCYIQNKGIDTLIIDTNNDILELIKNKITPFIEYDLQNQLDHAINNGLQTTLNLNEIKDCNIVIITLGTSSDKHVIKKFNQLIDDVISKITEGSTIILRSTVTLNTINKIIEDKTFNTKKLHLYYCPERIAEGKAFLELDKIPQIIGSRDNIESELILNFFKELNIKTISVNFEEAVFIKLFLNTYRYSQFSTINYFDNIASTNSLDFKKLLGIASESYPRLENVPDSGMVGGPCLIKDSHTFIDSFDDPRGIISKYFEINKDFIKNIIIKCESKFDSKKIVQLGLTFKPESDDLRDSQSIELNKSLIKEGYEVKTYDPFINSEEELSKIMEFSNNILISTHHKIFDSYDFTDKKVVIVGDK